MIQKTKSIDQIIDTKRQISLLKRLPGFRLWEDVMQEDQILYKWNIVMYKNQLYRLNRDSNNYIWAKMKTDYIMTDYRIGRDGNDYFQGEIVETSSGYLYEIYKDGIGDYDTNEVGTERTYEELENNVILRPNGFGIKILIDSTGLMKKLKKL